MLTWAGPPELRYETLAVNGADGQLLVAYHAEPGSTTERGLALLSTMVAERCGGVAPGKQSVSSPSDSTFGPSD